MSGPVAAQLEGMGEHAAAGDLRRGQRITDVASAAVKGLPSVGRSIMHAGNAALAPLGVIGKPLLRGMGNLGSYVSKSPGAQKALIALGLGIPTLGSAAVSSMDKNVQEQLNASNNPGRTVLAHHFMKTAAAGGLPKAYGHSFSGEMSKSISSGIGKGVGDGLISSLLSMGSSLGGKLIDSTVTAPKREKVFYEAVKTDPVLRDALRGNPAVLTQMKEAFATMVRFAPSLSLDINAVRSYLREAVISGGGINYATIKQLADTEKVIHDRNTPRGK